MATRVEELRKVIVSDWWFEQKVMDEVDALISAARAEGAEQERERIRKVSRFLLANENVEEGFELCTGDEEYGSYIIVPTDNYRLVRETDMFPEVPASVLAPDTKEGK
jgi:hypothetical protein